MSDVTIAKQLNNPINIRYNKSNNWKGQIGQEKGFVHFSEIYYGIRAGVKLLQGYINRDIDTISMITNRLAPPAENDTLEYIDFLEKRTGIKRDKKLKHGDLITLAPAYFWKESHTTVTPSQVEEILIVLS